MQDADPVGDVKNGSGKRMAGELFAMICKNKTRQLTKNMHKIGEILGESLFQVVHKM